MHFQGMFELCTNLETLDISSFTGESAEAIDIMFLGCTKLKKLV